MVFSHNARNNEVSNLDDKVNFYKSDRNSIMDFAKLLKYISEKAGINEDNQWDLVVDFCAYIRKHVKSVIRGLSKLVRLYILISTDSVYEVCAKEFRDGPIKESDALRPEHDEEIAKLSKDDPYGHDKLRCEEYLRTHVLKNRELSYMIFRLPDVIGPYDSSNRYWNYLMWIQKMNKWPIHAQDLSDTRKLSFVFSEDVAGFIHHLLPQISGIEGLKFVDRVHGQSFNLAFSEIVTLNELLTMMVDKILIKAKQLKAGDVNLIHNDKLPKLGIYLYPSAECGTLSTEKAKSLIGWQSTPIDQAIQITNDFYTQAGPMFRKEHDFATRQLLAMSNEYYPDAVPTTIDAEKQISDILSNDGKAMAL